MLMLKKFNPRKATGFDNIPCKILRLAHQELSKPLAYIINSFIMQYVFPDDLKCAELSPILKKNDSLSKPSISKISERIMDNQKMSRFYHIFHVLLSAF